MRIEVIRAETLQIGICFQTWMLKVTVDDLQLFLRRTYAPDNSWDKVLLMYN